MTQPTCYCGATWEMHGDTRVCPHCDRIGDQPCPPRCDYCARIRKHVTGQP